MLAFVMLIAVSGVLHLVSFVAYKELLKHHRAKSENFHGCQAQRQMASGELASNEDTRPSVIRQKN